MPENGGTLETFTTGLKECQMSKGAMSAQERKTTEQNGQEQGLERTAGRPEFLHVAGERTNHKEADVGDEVLPRGNSPAGRGTDGRNRSRRGR